MTMCQYWSHLFVLVSVCVTFRTDGLSANWSQADDTFTPAAQQTLRQHSFLARQPKRASLLATAGDKDERLTAMFEACGAGQDDANNDKDQVSVLFAGLWVMKQLSPEAFSSNGKNVVEKWLPKYSQLKSNEEEPLCGTYSQANLDVWYFSAMPGGFGKAEQAPSNVELLCLLQYSASSEVRDRIKAGKMKTIQVITHFIFSMELELMMKFALLDTSKFSAAITNQLPAFYTNLKAFYELTDGMFLIESSSTNVCKKSAVECGYYLTHRALQQTNFFSQKLANVDRSLALMIGDSLRRDVVPYFRKQAAIAPLAGQDVDLASEVVLVFNYVVPKDDDASKGNFDSLVEELGPMITKAAVKGEGCHFAVTTYFACNVGKDF